MFMAKRNTTIRKHKEVTVNSINSFLMNVDFATKNEIAKHLKNDLSLPKSIRNSAGRVADYIVKAPVYQSLYCTGERKSMWLLAKL